MKNLILFLSLLTTLAFGQSNLLRTTDFQQSLNAKAPRNYIINSGYEKNTKSGVTDANSIVTRNTVNPIEGSASFEVGAGTSTTHQAKWTAQPLQAGLFGQSCVGSFKYVWDAAGYQAWVENDSSVVVSQVVNLINSESGGNAPANKVELTFPCGVSGGTYRIVIKATGSQSALSFKADSFYLGEWDGVGSVAQSEVLLNATRITSNQSISGNSPVQVVFNSAPINTYGEYSTSTGTFTSAKTQRLLISVSYETANVQADDTIAARVNKNGSNVCVGYTSGAATTLPPAALSGCVVDVVSGDTITALIDTATDTSYEVAAQVSTKFVIQRIPTTGEIVTRVDAPGSDWTAFTPTVTHGSGSATNVTHAGWYRCNGGDLELKYQSTFSNTSAAFSVWYYGLPTNFAALTTVNNDNLGFARFDDAGTAAFGGVVRIDTSTRLLVQYQAISTHTGTAPLLANQNISNTLPFTWTTSDSFTAYARVPVTASSPCAAAKAPLIKQGVVYDTNVIAQGLNGVTTIENGIYGPTPVGLTNVSAVSTAQCQYQRAGKIVNVSCRVPLTCTTGGLTTTTVDVPLPIASNLSALGDLNGVFGPNAGLNDGGGVCIEDTTNDRASCTFSCTSTTSLAGRRLMFQYEVK